MRKSAILTKKLADKAIQHVLPAILAMMESKTAKRHALHIVVMEPLSTPTDPGGFNRAILTEYFIKQDGVEWEHPFNKFARLKTELTWKNRRDSAEIRNAAPWLFQAGDFKYAGAVIRDGIIVGVSGVQAEYDQMYAEWIAAAIKAECLLRANEALLDKEFFIEQFDPEPTATIN
jgi:hypothetical protein